MLADSGNQHIRNRTQLILIKQTHTFHYHGLCHHGLSASNSRGVLCKEGGPLHINRRLARSCLRFLFALCQSSFQTSFTSLGEVMFTSLCQSSHVYIYIYIYTYLSLYTYIYIIEIHILTFTLYLSISLSLYIYIYVCVCVYVYVYIYIYIYIS